MGSALLHQDLIPCDIVVAPGFACYDGGQHLDEAFGGGRCRQQKHDLGRAFVVRAVLRRELQSQLLKVLDAVVDLTLFSPQRVDATLDAVELDVEERTLEFVGTSAVGSEGHEVFFSARPVKLAGVDDAPRPADQFRIIGDHGAAFTGRYAF